MDQLSDNDIAAKAREIAVDTTEPPLEYPYGMEQQTKSRHRQKQAEEDMGQLSLFDSSSSQIKTDDIIVELHDLDLSATTPIEAMNILYRIQTKLKERI